ncbi:CaiB/BaiF CoA transferase family protein [Futiania mangrovi]|nr:CoA transferase [Futiania mangrovii]
MTVIAVEQYGAGPFGSMLLADMGADVIKIENPAEGGEVGRHVGPFYFDKGDSHFYQAFNRNKRSITLNLKHPEGQRIFRALVAKADATLDNLRGDLPEKLGVTFDALKDANPKIVCAHLSAYGRTGSRKTWPGYDYLMQAETGYLSLTGEPDGPPARMGLSIVDMMTGLLAAYALTCGVFGARETGKGRDMDVSLFDTALHNLSYLATWYLNGGHVQGREARSAHPSLVPSALYRTKDGWIFLMCNKEKFWPILAEKLGHPEWADDPRFRTFKDRLENRDLVTEILDAALMQKTTDEWTAILGGAVPAAPVHNVAQALENPFVAERGGVADFARRAGEAGPPVRMLTGPVRVGGAEVPARAAPALGGDTADVLSTIGLGPDDIARLRADRVI